MKEKHINLTNKELARYQELTDRLANVFRDQVPFHQLIGFTFDEISLDKCCISFYKKPELIGNFVREILHGGVTATALDVVGGTMAAAGMLSRNLNMSDVEINKKIAKTSTIDLRVDFLRPGYGDNFYAKAKLLRSGNKVAVVRMELHGQDDTLIALGTGTYLTG